MMTVQTGNWWIVLTKDVSWILIQPSHSINSSATKKYTRGFKKRYQIIHTDMFEFTTHTGMDTWKTDTNMPNTEIHTLEQYNIYTPCTMSNQNRNK